MKALMMSTLGASALLACLYAQAQVSPEDQIEYRQAGYSFMSWNMGKIKALVMENSADLDAKQTEQVQSAANAIAAIANSGMGALYGQGTAQDKMGDKTRLKAEFFQNMEEAGKLAHNFNAAANKLAAEAATGDKAKIKVAFGELGGTCKACHDQFRSK